MIFCVVYWHISIYTGTTDSPVNVVFMPFYLTLFFYISGFFSFSSKELTLKTRISKIVRRFKTLLIPTVVMCTLYSLYCGKSIEQVLFNNMKGGYWFTFVAFEIYIFYVIAEYTMSSIRCRYRLTPYITIIVLFSLLSLVGHKWDGYSIYRLFSTYQVIKYLPFFYLGVISRQYLPVFNNLLKKDLVILVGMVAMISLYIFPSRITVCVQGYLGIYLIFAVFLKLEQYFTNTNQISGYVLTVGRSTMPIYFLHYFFLSGIAVLSTPLQLVMNQGGWVVNFLLTSSTAIILVAACIIVERVLSVSPTLHRICFGISN